MSTHLVIPESIFVQHAILLGKTGKGKSSLLRYLVEHLAMLKKRVVVIDPKGDWWGIKVGADGKSAGFPYILLGDFKDGGIADVPINEHSGSQIANLIAGGNRPCVIGMRGWMPAQMTKFWIHFASTLFNENAGELYLVIDEIQNFAPKERFGIGEENMAVYWSKKMLSEGRGLGLTMFCGSQRPQAVHNGVLTQCETLFAMGLTHDADCTAVETWLKRTKDKTLKEQIMTSLPELGKGEAWVWSPEVKFGPRRVQFPLFTTFDSFAPPQLQKKVSQSGWSNVDLNEVKTKLANVIEEAKANDPSTLKRRIADLERQVATATAKDPGPPPEPQRIEVNVVRDEDMHAIRGMVSICENHQRDVEGVLHALKEQATSLREIHDRLLQIQSASKLQVSAGTRPVPASASRSMPKSERPAVSRQTPHADSGALANGIDAYHQIIIDCISMLNMRKLTPNRDMVARWLDLHPNNNKFNSALARLRADGYLNGLVLTDRARACPWKHGGGYDGMVDSLHHNMQGRIAHALSGGQEYSRDELAAAIGVHPNNNLFNTHIARLRTMGILPERGVLKLTDNVY